MKPVVTWIVAADGGRVRHFENRGPGKGLVPMKELNLDGAHLRAQDIESDRPGRAVSPTGRASAIDAKTDPVQHQEELFAQGIAAQLESKWKEQAFGRLIIAAAPTALGNIRRALSPALNAAVIGELHKDLTKVPTEQLGSHFEGLLAI